MIKKFIEYFFLKIDENLLKQAMLELNEEEKEIFSCMDNYDKLHSLNVYKNIKKTNLDKIYIKLALLHDVGKGKANFLIRCLHKLGFNTKLRNHSKLGYYKLIDIDEKLANLILIHHDKDVDENMKIFQEVDDVN